MWHILIFDSFEYRTYICSQLQARWHIALMSKTYHIRYNAQKTTEKSRRQLRSIICRMQEKCSLRSCLQWSFCAAYFLWTRSVVSVPTEKREEKMFVRVRGWQPTAFVLPAHCLARLHVKCIMCSEFVIYDYDASQLLDINYAFLCVYQENFANSHSACLRLKTAQ